ncbi:MULTISPECIES: DedA family protein [Neobacillus]|uniref:DedA family protein n=1 Tax=Neobacillus rhizophilus TaxID=2833579 RepID=A0A942YXY3_9BACI|nr:MULTISPECIES: DedA family protein [Neobacillus]MBS4216494.1 DedA family protein [Neobacillus rhizophilus]MBU8919831.1 DedA family protein [Bacillus sp. FJAT-29953]
MEVWIKDFIESYGYIGVFLLIALENIFPPIPSEVILTFGGYMTLDTSLNVTGVIIASTLGSVLGAVILYRLGNFLDVERFDRIINRYGKLLRLKKEDLYRANAWFNKYGIWTVFLCRFIPLIRSLISIPAGMANMNFSLFLIFTTIGTLIWNTILIHLGASLGENWELITEKMDNFSNVIYGILFGLLMVGVITLIRKSLKSKKI